MDNRTIKFDELGSGHLDKAFEQAIPTYVINLKSRTDRKSHIIKEFEFRNEFNVEIIEACEDTIGPIGLWKSIQKIVRLAQNKKEGLIVICEDDHQFTSTYSSENFFSSISNAYNLDADILSGGTSWFTGAFPCTENIYWVEMFSGTQFFVVFQKFFDAILNADFGPGDNADYKICMLTEKKFLMCPFISLQKDFGYSDVTSTNNVMGKVGDLFKSSSSAIEFLDSISKSYTSSKKDLTDNSYDINTVTIPTYIINRPERPNGKENILKQFAGREEFDLTFVDACRHEMAAVGKWQSLCKIIELAIHNDDDVIVVCEDDHEFTEYYNRNDFIRILTKAHYQNADYLSGGSRKFGLALQISADLLWVSKCFSFQFLVIYKKFFDIILNEPYEDKVMNEILLSDITANKMLFSPFISKQTGLDHFDVSQLNQENAVIIPSHFEEGMSRSLTLRKAYLQFANNH